METIVSGNGPHIFFTLVHLDESIKRRALLHSYFYSDAQNGNVLGRSNTAFQSGI